MSFKKRKIICVTGARSEYDIVSPVLEVLANTQEFELGVVVTGSHLCEEFGYTISEIEKDGYPIIGRIFNLIHTGQKIGRILSLANQIPPLVQIFDQWKPDIVMVAGDREEAISVSMTAAFLNIAVAHIAGGDIAQDGNIDNSIRYATSKFAHIHFPILPQHKNNLIKLGENEWRIFDVGNPALDKFIRTPQMTISELEKKTGFDLSGGNFGILIYHPIITQVESEEKNIKTIIDALDCFDLKIMVNHPNSDAGYNKIAEYYKSIQNKKFTFFKNLDRLSYINLLRYSKILLGNSSSGIIEAPTLKLPVVNIGPRQRSRTHTSNVVFVDYDKQEIINAIKYVLSNEFIGKMKSLSNPYGNGDSAMKIVNILSSIKLDSNLIHKNINYI